MNELQLTSRKNAVGEQKTWHPSEKIFHESFVYPEATQYIRYKQVHFLLLPAIEEEENIKGKKISKTS